MTLATRPSGYSRRHTRAPAQGCPDHGEAQTISHCIGKKIVRLKAELERMLDGCAMAGSRPAASSKCWPTIANAGITRAHILPFEELAAHSGTLLTEAQ